VKSILMTGDRQFLERFRFLAEELGEYGAVDRLEAGPAFSSLLARRSLQLLHGLWHGQRPAGVSAFYKQPGLFVRRSKRLERQIARRAPRPDYVLHLMSMFCPRWRDDGIPYGMFLDYTMALCQRYYPAWAAPDGPGWLAVERQAYHRADHLFAASHVVADSLVHDYGQPPQKITVAGLSGSFREPYLGPKSVGSRRLLFYNLEFHRKGGDLLLEAFVRLRRAVPDATLTVVGDPLPERFHVEGVQQLGWRSAAELRALYLQTDLILAPARCEPFGHFLVEAMNFGVPCVVSQDAGNGITPLLHDGENAMLLSDPTPQRLAATAQKVLTDRACLERLSAGARRLVAAELNWRVIAAKLWRAIYAGTPGTAGRIATPSGVGCS
jgi:glycosyltransferase involved in cell wall biosynthesis